MKVYFFTLNNAKSRRFAVQVRDAEAFIGFMFGISRRCEENNLWFLIEDQEMEAEFRARSAGLSSLKVETWIAEKYSTSTQVKAYMSIKLEKRGASTCLIYNYPSFIGGLLGSMKPIEGLKDIKSSTFVSLMTFTSDPKVAKNAVAKIYNDERAWQLDGTIADGEVWYKKNSSLGYATPCCVLEWDKLKERNMWENVKVLFDVVAENRLV